MVRVFAVCMDQCAGWSEFVRLSSHFVGLDLVWIFKNLLRFRKMIIGMIKIMTLNNENTISLCEYRIILNVLIVCLFLKEITFPKNFFQESDQSTKQFGSWSDLLFWWAWSGFEMFAKQKISCTELNVTISINAINYYLLRGPEPDCLFL